MTTSTSPTELQKIMTMLDLYDLPDDVQEEFLLDLNSLIFKGSLVRLIERMDEPTRRLFDTLMDSDPEPEEVERFFDTHVPHAEGVVMETVDEITSDILASTGH